MENLFHDVKRIIIALIPHCESMEITPETRIKEELGIDSLRLVQVIVNLEEQFGVAFDEADLDPRNITHVQRLMDLVLKAQG